MCKNDTTIDDFLKKCTVKQKIYLKNLSKLLKNIKKYIAIILNLWYNFVTKIDKYGFVHYCCVFHW